jgi:hypothetical protein
MSTFPSAYLSRFILEEKFQALGAGYQGPSTIHITMSL